MSSLLCFAQNEILNNQSIIDLVKLGFSDEIIISKIDECVNTFDTSIKALTSLKENNVSEAIIVAMVSASKTRKENMSNIENSNLEKNNLIFSLNFWEDRRFFKIIPKKIGIVLIP